MDTSTVMLIVSNVAIVAIVVIAVAGIWRA